MIQIGDFQQKRSLIVFVRYTSFFSMSLSDSIGTDMGLLFMINNTEFKGYLDIQTDC